MCEVIATETSHARCVFWVWTGNHSPTTSLLDTMRKRSPFSDDRTLIQTVRRKGVESTNPTFLMVACPFRGTFFRVLQAVTVGLNTELRAKYCTSDNYSAHVVI